QTLESLPLETKTELWARVRDLEEGLSKGTVEDNDAGEVRDIA
ncbi:unnamed protein product, partial [Chrysoparadoxa australica]